MIRAIALLCLSALPALAGEIAPDALDRLSGEVVILGEVHDNPAHHLNQARAVAALRPKAVVFEMLTPEQAAAARPELRGDAAALGSALGWEAAGWPDFAIYYPIFAAAGSAEIRGGGLPREDVRRAVKEGAAAVFGGEAALYGLDRPLGHADLAERVAEQGEAHCGAMPAEMLPGMVEAQRLRDAGLGRAILAALDETGGPVAVITGNGHARRDWGIPAVLAVARPALAVTVLGQFEDRPEGEIPFDLWLVTAPAERDDPCKALKG